MSVTEIIYADLVPLPERGSFLGITASVWAFASAIGPPIAGALTSSGSWRWLFFLNLPVCAISIVMVMLFMRVKAPRESFASKMVKMDWICAEATYGSGNFVIVASTTSIMLALTWAGLRFAWNSVEVLVPLCLGFVGIVCFFIIEIFWSSEPTVPWSVVANRTSFSGYIATFFHGIVSIAVIYYLPVYFQTVKLASPIGSGVDMFGASFTVAPSAILCGSSRAKYIGFQIVLGVGIGMIWIATQFPILAPLPFSNNARTLAFFTFVRCFAQSWGVAIGGTILQNSLRKKLPAAFDAQFPFGVQIA
ncbi:MFS general substrate transporter, partial [Artomyces pyxidatus]